MPTFRKKPVEIEAVQFTHKNREIIEGYEEVFAVSFPVDALAGDARARIKTEEGVLRVDQGDWIITGVEGERYPCKPEIFEQTHERAEARSEEQADAEEIRNLRAACNDASDQLAVELRALQVLENALHHLSQRYGDGISVHVQGVEETLYRHKQRLHTLYERFKAE